MAEQQTTTSQSLPPQYIQDFLAGQGAGSGVPGLFPLLNQSMLNQFSTLGQPGATPFTYQGERIAGFDPRETASFELADQAIGSYMPYLNRQQDLLQGGLDRGIGGLDQATQLQLEGADRTLAGLDEAGMRYRGLEGLQDRGFRQAEDLYRQGTDMSLAGLGDATSAARGAYGLLGSQLGGSNLTARGTLQDAARTSLGATQQFDPSSTSAYMNPFEDQVVQRTLSDIRDQGSVADQTRRAREIGSGAFGGSRSRLQAGELAEAQREAEIDAVGGIRAGGFQQAQQQAAQNFENQQRRQAAAASQLGNIAGGLGSLAGQQATAGQNLANQLSNFGQAGGNALANLGGVQAGLTNQRVNLGQNLASGIAGLGQIGGATLGNLGSNLGALGLQGAGLMQGTGNQFGAMGNNLGQLQRGDISLLGSVGGANRAMNQAANDLAYQNFVGQYNLPANLLGQYSGIAQGIGPLGGGSVTQTTGTPGISYNSSALGGFTNALGQTFMNA